MAGRRQLDASPNIFPTGSTTNQQIIPALAGRCVQHLALARPEREITVRDWNQHISMTARIGQINSEGLIDEVWVLSEGSVADVQADPRVREVYLGRSRDERSGALGASLDVADGQLVCLMGRNGLGRRPSSTR